MYMYHISVHAQVHELPQSYCGDNREGIYIYRHVYILYILYIFIYVHTFIHVYMHALKEAFFPWIISMFFLHAPQIM